MAKYPRKRPIGGGAGKVKAGAGKKRTVPTKRLKGASSLANSKAVAKRKAKLFLGDRTPPTISKLQAEMGHNVASGVRSAHKTYRKRKK